MNQRKAKRIRAELRENFQDPYFSKVPIHVMEKAVKRATRSAKKFYTGISRQKRNRFEIIQ